MCGTMRGGGLYMFLAFPGRAGEKNKCPNNAKDQSKVVWQKKLAIIIIFLAYYLHFKQSKARLLGFDLPLRGLKIMLQDSIGRWLTCVGSPTGWVGNYERTAGRWLTCVRSPTGWWKLWKICSKIAEKDHLLMLDLPLGGLKIMKFCSKKA